MTNQRQALAAVLEVALETDCRHCGEPMVPNYTRENLCGWCWRNANPEVQAFRVAHGQQTRGRMRARRGAR